MQSETQKPPATPQAVSGQPAYSDAAFDLSTQSFSSPLDRISSTRTEALTANFASSVVSHSAKPSIPASNPAAANGSKLPVVGAGEYYPDQDRNESPVSKLREDIGKSFSSGEYFGGIARLALAAAPIAAGVVAGYAEAIGGVFAGASVAAIPIGFLAGYGIGGMLAFSAVTLASWGAGAGVTYCANRVCHNIRHMFGDTSATWEQSLAKGVYPFVDPLSFFAD